MEKIFCKACATYKDPKDFYYSNKDGSRVSHCKQCNKRITARSKRKFKQQLVDLKGGKCQKCGYDKYIGALEFHHLDESDKYFSFGDIKKTKLSKEILDELDKCVLLCANCHREEHAGEEYPELFEGKFKKDMFDSCVCGSKKLITNKYCSRDCANKARRKVDWDNVDVVEILKSVDFNFTQAGRYLGISDNAVRKRYNKVKVS